MPAPEQSKRYTLLLVDDRPDYLAQARALLAGHPELQVVGEAHTVQQALDLLLELEPAAAIIDLQIPDLGGFEAAKCMLAADPGLRIILVSATEAPDVEALALDVGAVAFLPKEQLTAQAVAALLAEPRC